MTLFQSKVATGTKPNYNRCYQIPD